MKITLPRLLSVALPLGAFSSLALATQSDEKLVPAYPPASGRTTAAATAAPSSGSTQPLIATCLPAIKDQTGPGCIQASSIPTLGDLLPLSPLFNVTPLGDVGIGTSAPDRKLEVVGTARVRGLLSVSGNFPIGQPGSGIWVNGNDNGPLFPPGTPEGGIRIFNNSIAPGASTIQGWDYFQNIGRDIIINDAGGDVGIGTSTPTASFKLDVNGGPLLGRQGARFYGPVAGSLGNTTALSLVSGPSAAGWDFNINESGAPGLYFSEVNANFNNLVLRRGGRVGVGTSAPQELLDVAGNVRCVSLIQTSAREFKQDIAPLTGALDSLLKLQGVSYSWNDKAPKEVQGHEDIGFIADDVDAVLPEIVSKDEDGNVLGLDYGKITPVAVEAIKELNAKNEELSAKNTALEARLAKLEALFAGQTK